MLDQMAATVVYSRQHLLEKPYIVQPGETLDSIADQYNVPSRLLAKINGIHEGQNPQPGRELKVLRGPFMALVDLNRLELTLMLHGRYAGRFAIGVGADHPKLEGTYIVRDKRLNPPGPPRDPTCPPGKLWIDLGNQITIHAAADPRSVGRTDGHGSICLSDQDMTDVFGILSVGSRVEIQR
jgi:LysM repeat protein